MKSKVLICAIAAIIFAVLALAVRLSAQSQQESSQHATYVVHNLGTLGGTASGANSINNIGWATGFSNRKGDKTQHAAVWIYGLKFDLGTLGGPNSGVEWPNKNDRGVIAGISETAALDPLGENWSCAAFFPTITHHTCLGFRWEWGNMTALPTLGGNNGYAAGINNRGEIAGWAENTVHDSTCVSPQVLQFEAVVWGPEKDQIKQLPTYHGDPDGAATAINNKGQVVGISGICGTAVGEFSAAHALLWENGTVTNIGSLGGVAWNTPAAINDRGVVVGFSDLPGDKNGAPNFHAFRWTKEHGIHDLGTLPGDVLSEALGINERGQIVGESCQASFTNCRAFLWEDGKMTDLNKLVANDTGLHLVFANDINDRGQIVGGASDQKTGTSPAFIAIPKCDSDDDHNE
ncbi:MAG: hypothetical protein JOY62_00380 [Acidobacteriaceae bacterium]|nr:hypothetical protein [Acidobacteriaceae bacterium]MBV9778400.1 hypothetical protein [Acidobacteriaceae bacterium]